jgi:hypothetical protein
MRGCHLSFPDYHRNYLNQQSIRGRDREEEDKDMRENPRHFESRELQNIISGERDIDGNLAQHYFLRAIEDLPNLRHLTFGDYRALAVDGESYVKLCRRLFGQSVCPKCSLTDRMIRRRFNEVIYDLQKDGRVWDSLSIGRHPFETSYSDYYPSVVAAGLTAQGDALMYWDWLTHVTRVSGEPELQV